MIKPSDIDDVVWDVIAAANNGDVDAMRHLLAADPGRSCEGYFYTPPIHFAVREGHLDVVRILLDAGADPEWNGHYGLSLIELARERGHQPLRLYWSRLVMAAAERRQRQDAKIMTSIERPRLATFPVCASSLTRTPLS